MPLTAATRIGPYEIRSPLGGGGMRVVFRARDSKRFLMNTVVTAGRGITDHRHSELAA